MGAAGRIVVLLGLLGAGAVGLAFAGPIPQDPAYHGFADSGTALGLSHFGNVLSSAAFALVGLLGLTAVSGIAFDHSRDRLPYLVFFAGAVAVGFGSGWYHMAPDNARLVWDRLPMTIAFMALIAAFVADRIDRKAGVRWVLPALLALGAASVLYWDWTEARGRGDLRFYALVQFGPMILLPVLCWLFPRHRYTDGRYLAAVFGFYALSKILEYFDAGIGSLTGGAVTGHPLKHLAAAAAVYMIVPMLKASRR